MQSLLGQQTVILPPRRLTNGSPFQQRQRVLRNSVIAAQLVQPQGFTSLNGSGLGVVEGFMEVGEPALDNIDGFYIPCPVGQRVDGYQVVVGALIYQIRPRCSCFNCGALPAPVNLCRPACCSLISRYLAILP